MYSYTLKPQILSIPTAQGSDPELLPASPATSTALSHTQGEELGPHPNLAASGVDAWGDSPSCNEDKINAKEPRGIPGDLRGGW